MTRRFEYCAHQLHTLWARGASYIEIAAALGCSQSYIQRLKVRHKLPYRQRPNKEIFDNDPTPEQIAERAAECRAEREKNMPPPAQYRSGIREYSWQGGAFYGRA